MTLKHLSLQLGFALAVILLTTCGRVLPTPTLLPTASPTAPNQIASTLEEQRAALYNAHCLNCHGGATGGQMMDYPPRHNANGHTWHHPDCQLIEMVLNGSGEMGEMMGEMMGIPEDVPRMPTWKGTLTEEEVAAILAYIKTWWTDEQRQIQAEITQAQCG
jgi:mono/diheme cytochrome c family protein